MSALSKLTDMQNRMLDHEIMNQKYNKDIQEVEMKTLSSCYDSHSDFYKGKSLWMIAGAVAQVALIGISQKSSETIPEAFAKIAGEAANKSITIYHDNLSPQFTSIQTRTQKKLDLLVQSANTEINKSNQLQQTLQNAKESFSQLLKK